LKNGSSEPVCEEYVLKLMGSHKLES